MPLSRGDLYCVGVAAVTVEATAKYRLMLKAGASKVHIRRIIIGGACDSAGGPSKIVHATGHTAGSEAAATPINLNASASAAAVASAYSTSGATDITLTGATVLGGIDVSSSGTPGGNQAILDFKPGEFTLLAGECLALQSPGATSGWFNGSIFFQEGD